MVSGSTTVTMSDEFCTSEANRASLCCISRSSVSAALSSARATCEDRARSESAVVRGISSGVDTIMSPCSSSRMNSGATKTEPSSSEGSASVSRSVLS